MAGHSPRAWPSQAARERENNSVCREFHFDYEMTQFFGVKPACLRYFGVATCGGYLRLDGGRPRRPAHSESSTSDMRHPCTDK
ncbi:hypothetical protein EVAR_69523_1 [Eumeta japonica]|uniref:Uncharacterized protein n=1 Tax=Eumeta variegata TaxID=151549 RepID=A0A4C2A1J2_EUMVA|nr:hypothetical protein EVAR_69523_1 [Eumeta japonica]